MSSTATVILTFLLITIVCAQTNRCYSCASGSLNRRWGITQLRASKTIVFDTQQTKKCKDINNEDSPYLVNCTGACMDLIFQDPDSLNQAESDDLLYVRGCHSELTGVTQTQGINLQNNEYCEYDATWNTFKCDGTMTDTEANFRLCTGDKCNNHKGVDGTGICAHTSVTDRQCFECEKVNGECRNKKRDPASRKSKKYCTKSYTKLDGTNTYYVTQSNSDINLYYVPNFCTAARQTSTPIGGLTVAHGQVVQCVCSDQDRCNNSPIRAFISSSLLIFVSFLFK
ncbi:unnamed protein product, partial [Mesorhabditis belari]|uniref:Uncharacterized protein n=1 Tax=Mesorhabditis belari TaxID=2138241 RepID=A0AAF3F0V6_9BILA